MSFHILVRIATNFATLFLITTPLSSNTSRIFVLGIQLCLMSYSGRPSLGTGYQTYLCNCIPTLVLTKALVELLA